MTGSIRLIPSGFSLIDKKWGGIYRGGSYLLIGPRKSGRTLLGLQFAMESAKKSEVCLYFTNMRPKDLMIQAASIDFDIQSYMNQNSIIVVRVAPPTDIYDLANPDEFLIEYLNDIITVVNQYNPSRIIFDELTPYVGFNNLDLLKEVFLQTLETIEERDISSLFVIGEPATEPAQLIIDTIAQYVTGVIYLKKDSKKIENKFHGGKVVITPNVGHTEGQFSETYTIQPYHGVTIEDISNFSNNEKIEKPDLNYTGYDVGENSTKINKKTVIDESHNLTEKITPSDDSINFSNIYSHNDFQLILNNQIALYKSTGQKFHLVSFKLDPAAHVKGLLTLNQLQKAVSNAADKKDKICIEDNKVMALLIRSTKTSVLTMAERIKNHLPSKDINYIEAVMEYISMINVEVDERVENAEGMFRFVLSEEPHQDHYYEPIKKFVD